MKKELLVDLPKITDRRGSLSFIEPDKHIPFSIAESYLIYGSATEVKSEELPSKEQQEFIISLSGSFDVVVDDGENKRLHTLNRTEEGLYIPNALWRRIENFSSDAVCLILASKASEDIKNTEGYKICDDRTIQNHVEIDAINTEVSSTNLDSVLDYSLIELPSVNNGSGNLIPVQGRKNIPFDVKRVFYIYDIPTGTTRGMHAHKTCDEVLIAVSGSFVVELDDGFNKKKFRLEKPTLGLLIPRGVWATLQDYSEKAICLVLASETYKPENYINSYSDFKKYRKDGDKNL